MRLWAVLAMGLWLGACGQPAPQPSPTTPPTAPTPGSATPAARLVEPLTAPADALVELRGEVVARGTEPFWSVNIYPGKSIVYADPETAVPDQAAPALAYRAPVQANAGVVLFSSGDMTLALRRARCSDGMSDLVYPYEATITMGAQAPRKGCAYPRWSNDLINLIGAIDACLAKMPGADKPPVVWGQRDATGATLRFGFAKALSECRVGVDGAVSLKTLGDTVDPMVSQEDLIFYRAPAKNPGGECYEATKAKGAKGEDLGWLDTNEGC